MNELGISIIDPHAHLRDGALSDKATMDEVVAAGKKVGIDLYFDMPNLPEPVINRQRVDERIQLSKERGIQENYRLYVGLTADIDQVYDAVTIVDEYDKAIGLKLFAGESTGNLAVIDYVEQLKIYQALSDAGFKGVLVVHSEDQSIIDRNAWRFNPDRPWTWADARPGFAETYSVDKQIDNAINAGYKGRLQIAHLSYYDSIGLVRKGLNEKLDIGFELSPHHTLRSVEMLKVMPLDEAKQYKCNPSIKSESNRTKLWNFMADLKSNDPLYERVYIGSDYAPHEPGSKLGPNPPSGFADYSLYNEFIDLAQKDEFGMGKLKNCICLANSSKSYQFIH